MFGSARRRQRKQERERLKREAAARKAEAQAYWQAFKKKYDLPDLTHEDFITYRA